MISTYASLFTGIGGFDLPASERGWKIMFQVERDEFCNRVLENHFPGVPRFRAVESFEAVPYQGNVDLLSSGFPCQPFSPLGKQKGTADERYVWAHNKRILQELRPRLFVAENIRRITSSEAFEHVCLDLEAAGYKIFPFVFPTGITDGYDLRYRTLFFAYAAQYRISESKIQAGLAGYTPPQPKGQGQYFSVRVHGTDNVVVQGLSESDIIRTINGFPDWMDRIKTCGNAVHAGFVRRLYNAITIIDNALEMIPPKKITAVQQKHPTPAAPTMPLPTLDTGTAEAETPLTLEAFELFKPEIAKLNKEGLHSIDKDWWRSRWSEFFVPPSNPDKYPFEFRNRCQLLFDTVWTAYENEFAPVRKNKSDIPQQKPATPAAIVKSSNRQIVKSIYYPGNKHSAGIPQRIINQITPHDVFVSGFLGTCAIMAYKRPAQSNFGIDVNLDALQQYWTARTGINLVKADFLTWIAQFNFSKSTQQRWFIYLDPPYLLSTRRSGKIIYDHELSDDDHALSNVHIAISHYPCAEYDSLLASPSGTGGAAWRKLEYTTATHKGPVTEALYMNYPEPEELHEYTYLGGDRTRRQNQKRMTANMVNKLKSLPPLRRNAILAEVTAQLMQHGSATPPPLEIENDLV